ncbi:MAG TPA: hypothetical protein VGI56_01030 [Galbitalea sp.]|jgi:hypothetical protein
MSMFLGPFVIPPALASSADLAAWTGATAPANAAALLRSATILVLDATEGAYYNADPLTGLATDAQIKQAMNDATCIQAAAWAAISYDPLAGGIVTNTVKSSKKIGSASVTIEGAATAAASQAAASGQLVPEALKKLQQNNLLGNGPYSL